MRQRHIAISSKAHLRPPRVILPTSLVTFVRNRSLLKLHRVTAEDGIHVLSMIQEPLHNKLHKAVYKDSVSGVRKDRFLMVGQKRTALNGISLSIFHVAKFLLGFKFFDSQNFESTFFLTYICRTFEG